AGPQEGTRAPAKESDTAPPPPTVGKQRKKGKQAALETIRVSVNLIDRLMNLAVELVLGRNQLRQQLSDIVFKNPQLGMIMQNVDMVASELQENILQIRMQPLGSLLNKFPRLIRDISRQLSKNAELVIEGDEVELDKSILEGLSDPLMHLIRNCLDHGIEDPSTRHSLDKPEAGKIHIRASHEGGQVNISISDDGRGINVDKLVHNALTHGLITADWARRMSDKDKIDLIFHPGLSTAEKITDISGRGVGMDVVKTNIENLGGHLEIVSLLGQGTTFNIRLPLTLAIIPCLIVGSTGYRFAVPQGNVQELVCVAGGEVAERIEQIGNADVLRLRERLLPLIRLTDVLRMPRTFVHPTTGEVMIDRRDRVADRRSKHITIDGAKVSGERRRNRDRRRTAADDMHVVVLCIGVRRFGLVVDELFDNQEIVVKPLSEHIKSCNCFAGSTIMADGRVAMILDAAGIAEFARLNFPQIDEEDRRRGYEQTRLSQAKSRGGQLFLVFNNAYDEYFALAVENIARLEKIHPQDIHRVQDRLFMNYQGEGLPIISLERFLPVSPFPQDANELYVIIPKTDGPLTGILATRILDTVETRPIINKDWYTVRGLSGSVFLDGQLTMFLDINELLKVFSENVRGNRLTGEMEKCSSDSL
ncbi:MAG: chemotaxis protein CheW, partial [Deltaproteobacteria bacterium]|nr:chemotaxis protein CheW [Deltaproteobacteria bacterium]